MNCKRCGAYMIEGQNICSNCDYENPGVDDSNYYNNANIDNESQVYNEYGNLQNFEEQTYSQTNDELNTIQSFENNVDSFNYESGVEVKSISNKKQNIMLKIASIFALIASVGMLISVGGNSFIKFSLGNFSVVDLLTLIIPVIMLINAFFISNFNIGKSAFYDNKIIFIVFLCINFISAFLLKIYFLIFILSLIGFVISCKNNEDN